MISILHFKTEIVCYRSNWNCCGFYRKAFSSKHLCKHPKV